jgi:hypothetical protein
VNAYNGKIMVMPPGEKPVGRESVAHPAFSIILSIDFKRFQLVPKLYLGTKMTAKLSLAVIKGVPKLSLGTRKTIL